MKLSLSWILNHINYNDKINALELVSKFNTHSAEIESFSKVVFDKELFELVFCKLTNGYAEYLLPSQEQIILSERSLLQNGSYYLVKKSGPVGLFDWVKMSEFSKDRDGLFPAMMVSHEEFIKSSWKIYLPQEDIILDIDNKSLTNRPDMWGHRGIAREIAFY
jgi:phenylalanyl-tRNA synthetase beta chain